MNFLPELTLAIVTFKTPGIPYIRLYFSLLNNLEICQSIYIKTSNAEQKNKIPFGDYSH